MFLWLYLQLSNVSSIEYFVFYHEKAIPYYKFKNLLASLILYVLQFSNSVINRAH